MDKQLSSLYLSFVAICILMLLTFPVQAHTINGATGLINTPTASVLGDGELVANFSSFKGHYFAAVGLGVFPGVEVGLSSQLSSENQLSGTLKVNLLPEDKLPAVAVGLQTRSGGADYYIVASKQLGTVGLRGHFGLGTGIFRKGFGGISSVLNPVSISNSNNRFTIPLATFIIEYDGSGLNTGLSLKFSPDLSAKVYVTELSHIGFGFKYGVKF